jgi:hypothetical protein
MHLEGPTVTDPDLCFAGYISTGKRALVAQRNVFELAAYCATEHIGAKSILIYAYHKHNRIYKNNWKHSGWFVQPFNPKDVLVGNVLVEIDQEERLPAYVRPDLKIIVDDEVVFDSPWKQESLISQMGINWRTSR